MSMLEFVLQSCSRAYAVNRVYTISQPKMEENKYLNFLFPQKLKLWIPYKNMVNETVEIKAKGGV